MSRPAIEPILRDISASRQEVARHYGVHPYFTRRPSNVVRAYIDHYTEAGDTVLDPFGGSGVTAIEAMLLGRRAIHNDLNPFANFITAAIADTTLDSVIPLRHAFRRVSERCYTKVNRIARAKEPELKKILDDLRLPENIRLPRNSDAKFFFELFTSRQLAALAAIKEAIEQEADSAIRTPLLLAWSASVAKLNKTFLSAKGRTESRGGSSIFSIYRYKLAADVIELPLWETFEGRFLNVVSAKDEILRLRDYSVVKPGGVNGIDSHRDIKVLSLDAAELCDEVGEESVDYVFTDPPYGGHIAYLDLSILWNHWLGFPIEDSTAEAEAIVGGDRRLSDAHYKEKLAVSLKQCVKMLRHGRWLTVVFQHWDIAYFRVILESIADAGAELKAAITHDKDVIWSMHKKKNSQTVLGGEMLLTFHKSKAKTRRSAPKQTPTSLDGLLDRFLPALPTDGFKTETLFNKLTIAAWQEDSLQTLTVNPDEMIIKLRERGWEYDSERHVWTQQTQPAEFSLA